MSNIRFDGRTRKLKSRGFYIASIVCLIGFGVAAFFGLYMPRLLNDAVGTADAASSNGAVYREQTPSNAPEDVGGQSNKPQQSQNNQASSGTASIFRPSEVTEVVTPSANFFVMPIANEIIKDYSEAELQYSLTLGDWRLHKAVDIKGVTGDRINSAGDGTVTAVYDDHSYGLTVEINHGNEITAIYSGFETVVVAVGDVVAANSELGTLGKVPCESVETTHLHFSMQVGDKSVSPMNMIGVGN